MTIDFSIITITRNNRAGLKRTAESILAQTRKQFEWIIIDGASTDGTQDDFILYGSAQIISEPDSGIYDAMNKGIKAARGRYLIFMNAGDKFASPDTLGLISDQIGVNFYDLIYGDSIEAPEKGSPFTKRAKPHNSILRGLFTHHQSIFYNRDSLGTLRYDTSYRIAADYDLTLRFLSIPRACLYVPVPVCIFEGGGISQRSVRQGRREQFRARQENGVSLTENLRITFIQWAASTVRRIWPALYRYSQKDPWKNKSK